MGGARSALAPLGLLLDLIYPPRCASCGARGAWLCTACVARIRPLSAHQCARCHRPLASAPTGMEPGRCSTCGSAQDGSLAGLHVLARYEDPLRVAIHALKYRGQRGLVEPLGALLAHHAAALAANADVVVPVPLHPGRQRQRGYNQAALLAAACAARWRLPVEMRGLRRSRATRPQVGLHAAARRENVAGAFAVTPRGTRALAGKRVVLVDDVTTSGATLEAAARALLDGGAAAVWGLALAQPSIQAGGDSGGGE